MQWRLGISQLTYQSRRKCGMAKAAAKLGSRLCRRGGGWRQPVSLSCGIQRLQPQPGGSASVNMASASGWRKLAEALPVIISNGRPGEKKALPEAPVSDCLCNLSCLTCTRRLLLAARLLLIRSLSPQHTTVMQSAAPAADDLFAPFNGGYWLINVSS